MVEVIDSGASDHDAGGTRGQSGIGPSCGHSFSKARAAAGGSGDAVVSCAVSAGLVLAAAVLGRGEHRTGVLAAQVGPFDSPGFGGAFGGLQPVVGTGWIVVAGDEPCLRAGRIADSGDVPAVAE